MDEDSLRRLITGSPSADRLAGLMDSALPALRLRRFTVTQEDMAIGSSRIGGLPDLSVDVDWPRRRGRPLDFLAQIDLAEAAAISRLPGMPLEGRISFFYDEQDQPWGYDPEDGDGWKVLYSAEPPSSLRRMEPPAAAPDPGKPRGLLARLLGRGSAVSPLGPVEPFLPYAVRFEQESTLPDAYGIFADSLEDDDELWDRLEEIQEEVEPEDNGPYHRFGGHPSAIQGDMKLECQLVSNGLYCGDGNAYDSSRGRALAAAADDWQLLLQIDSDHYAGWMWGDAGRLYFWIRRQDLEARNFEKVWCILQCY